MFEIDYNSINSAEAFARAEAARKQQVDRVEKEKNRLFSNLENQNNFLEQQIKKSEDNYVKLSELYEITKKEAEQNKIEAIESKKYNKKMLIISLVSSGVAVLSLIATIVLALLK